MKKTLPILALVLCLMAGLVSGSLALYNTSVDLADSGAAIAKEFKFIAAGGENWEGDFIIAPSDKVERIFTVANFENDIVSEVPMQLTGAVTIAAADGKQAIPKLTANLQEVDSAGIPITDKTNFTNNMTAGVGNITLVSPQLNPSVSNAAFLPNVKATKYYKLIIEWPIGDATTGDEAYAGSGYGVKASATITGTQIAENATNQRPY